MRYNLFRKDRLKLKRERVLIIVIVVLIMVIIGMGIKMFMMNNDYEKQANDLRLTEHQIDLLKEQIEERCPGQFNFVD